MKTHCLFAALLSSALLVPPAAAEPPTVYAALLFAPYRTMGAFAKDYDPCRSVCVADFAKLVKAARAKNLIDYDPICQCQKGGDAYMMFTGATGANNEEYAATMKKVGKPGTWVVKLKWDDGGWKVNDIIETRAGKQVSLRQRLAGATT
jgi:hypothetical protein